ncbi:hypothetical protein LguiA_026440 [Lonicera macranthoides]
MVDTIDRLGINRYFGHEIKLVLDEAYRAPWHSITCTPDIPSGFTTERSAIVDLPPTIPPPHNGAPQLFRYLELNREVCN